MTKEQTGISPRETSRIFFRSLSCSQSLITVLDRAFGRRLEKEESAAHPLAGGLLHRGHQCGMIWGATLAAGADAYNRFGSGPKSEVIAIKVAKKIAESFDARAGAINCRDITDTDFLSFWSRMKYLFTGKGFDCARLAVKWAPEAFETIRNALAEEPVEVPKDPVSCAAIAARKMGASDMEATMAAGLAGGIGLTGGACGALGAAIWLTALRWYRENPEVDDNFLRALRHEASQKNDFYQWARSALKGFLNVTSGKILCSEIIGRNFKNIKDHADFLKAGGCSNIVEAFSAALTFK